jgi:chemotaxis protein CheZ
LPNRAEPNTALAAAMSTGANFDRLVNFFRVPLAGAFFVHCSSSYSLFCVNAAASWLTEGIGRHIAHERDIKRRPLCEASSTGEEMAAPRKVFRIEEIMAPRGEPPIDGASAPRFDDVMQEIAALRAVLADAAPQQTAAANSLRHDEVERIAAKLRLIRSTMMGTEAEHAGRNGQRPPAAAATRIGHELQAVIKASEQATEKILAAAEEIDQAANTLSAALKGDSEQGLAQDIRDRVIAIFEACNFQDLTCQRVAKVMATLERIETDITRTLDELTRDAAPSLHGPRLEGDNGHASQSDVDSMFGRQAKSA